VQEELTANNSSAESISISEACSTPMTGLVALPSTEAINKLCHLNIVGSTALGTGWMDETRRKQWDILTGEDTRDPPTPRVLSCKHCTFATITLSRHDEHVRACSEENSAIFNKALSKRPLPCYTCKRRFATNDELVKHLIADTCNDYVFVDGAAPLPDESRADQDDECNTAGDEFICQDKACNKQFEDAKGLAAHERIFHSTTWQDKPCEDDGCDPNKLFTNQSAYDQHRKTKHLTGAMAGWTPQPCPIPTKKCKPAPHTFGDAKKLVDHFTTKAHNMTREQASDEVTRLTGFVFAKKANAQKREAWTPTKCPRCIRTTVFKDRKAMYAHFTEFHSDVMIPQDVLDELESMVAQMQAGTWCTTGGQDVQ